MENNHGEKNIHGGGSHGNAPLHQKYLDELQI